MVWRLLAAGEPRLAAAAPFYGPFPTGGNLKKSRAAALEAARLKYELLTFTEADHAFFNDTGARFNPHAATEVWRRALNWFDDAGNR